jgi:hypothetical protein
MTVPAPQIVYDNTTTDLGWEAGGGPTGGLGSQITLGGTARIVTEFLFGYNGGADVKVDVKFRLNDGPHGGPGTVLFETGPSAITGGVADKIFSGLSVSVPDTFIGKVTWTGPKSAGFGLLGFHPATVGVGGQLWDYPTYVGPPPGWQKYVYGPIPRGFKARVTAVAPLARPAWSEVVVAQILAGVINDGGGWIEVGGHLVKVPPREPVEAMLAALPAKLAQRLTPLLRGPQLGQHPEAVLRQRLLNAIAQYQAESRG